MKSAEKVTSRLEDHLKEVRRHAAYSRGTGGGPAAPPVQGMFLTSVSDPGHGLGNLNSSGSGSPDPTNSGSGYGKSGSGEKFLSLQF